MEYLQFINKHPDKIPIIIEPIGNDIVITKKKYAVHHDQSFLSVMQAVRSHITSVHASESVFFTYKTKDGKMAIPTGNELVADMYQKSAYDGKFFIMSIKKETTFG